MTEHDRLKGLWCRGVATIDQIERCKVLDRQKMMIARCKVLCKLFVAFGLVFCLVGTFGGLSVGALIFDLEGAELFGFVMMHLVKFAQYSVIPASLIVLASLF